jgi:serine/threonine-protein kinase RsbW
MDHVHSHFETDLDVLDDEACVSKLLVHEWVANLMQHADFSDDEPEIAIRFEKINGSVRYVIEDNSRGFDLERYLNNNDRVNEPMPCRGMGLLMLSACSEELAYRRMGPRHNRLEFILKNDPGTLDVGLS